LWEKGGEQLRRLTGKAEGVGGVLAEEVFNRSSAWEFKYTAYIPIGGVLAAR
jgi:hypothetical protein